MILTGAVLATGIVAAALLYGPVQRSRTAIDMVDPGRAVEQAVLDAYRLAPALEKFLSEPDAWWPGTLNPDDLLPAKVLKKVAVAPGDTLMALLTEAGAEPSDSQAAINALNAKFNPRKLKVGQEITLTFERNDADSYRLFEMSLSPSVEREVNVTRVESGSFRVNEVIREFNIDHARV
ncbi:MAG: hypothetical protein CTR53_04960, partial [Ferrovibrio sp.]